MKIRTLKSNDIKLYEEDIVQCYMENLQITDSQAVLDITNRDSLLDYIFSIIECRESSIEAIFDENEKYLYGLIIYDSIRMTDDGNAAQLHLAISKELWGKNILDICQRKLKETIFDVLYCMIPAFCRPTISFVKKLDFKKTGYVPKALPYINLKGEEKMYDEYIYVWTKKKGQNA